ALFSLRPECIAPAGSLPGAAVRFRARIRSRSFAGATELLELECAGGQLLMARLPSGSERPQEMEFEFSAADAVCLRADEDD
ncbi:MAG: TOBE domain-containing protein, partial [Terriglobales bacterium]